MIANSTHAARVLCPALALAASGLLAVASPAAPPKPVSFKAVADADTVAGRGDYVEIRSDTRLVRAATVEWTAGVTGRIPRWTKDVRVASFLLITDDGRTVPGNLWAQGRSGTKRRSSVLLRPRSGPTMSVVLEAGETRPRLRITRLPSGTRSITVNTVGAGRDVLRFTGPCRRQRELEATRTTVQFGNGSQRVVRASGTGTCDDGVPREA